LMLAEAKAEERDAEQIRDDDDQVERMDAHQAPALRIGSELRRG
jgi:hypothetical protein